MATVNDQEKKEERHAPAALWAAWKRILSYTRPYMGRFVIGLVLTAGSALVWLAVPLGLQSLLDSVFERADRRLLDWLALGMLGLFVAQSALIFGSHYLTDWVGERVVSDLRKQVYAHLHRLGLRFYSEQRMGELTSRLTNDVGAIRNAATDAVCDVLTMSFTLMGSVAVMVSLNWRLSLVVFGAVPPVAFGARYFGQKIRKLSRGVQDRLADTTAVAEEALSAIRVVKAFAREAFEVARYNRAVEDLFQTARYRVLMGALFGASMGFLFLLALVIIFWYGGIEVLAGRLTTGALVAFIFYAFNISRSVMGVSRLYTTLNSAVGASERLFELLNAEPEIQDASGAVPLPATKGAVAFDGVSFSYGPDRPVLRDVSFAVTPGQTVAIVGPSGAGKTTLVNLIPRFYDATSGRVLIDGMDVRDVQVRSLREQTALVSQDVHLFGTSVRENIRYGRLDATDAEVEQAARDANAHDFIAGFPEGYEAKVGERGVKLSGGQRQRVAIARALLRDARILMLDEATSSLDSASEALVQEALERLMKGRTTFIIAHRLSTVQYADCILVLDEGRVVQTGTHAALIAQDGLYKELCRLQFRNMEREDDALAR